MHQVIGKELKIPCYINLNKLSYKQANHILDIAQHKLNCKFFLGRKFFLEDSHEISKDNSKKFKQTYIWLWFNDKNVLRIGISDHIRGGSTVYDYEGFIELGVCDGN